MNPARPSFLAGVVRPLLVLLLVLGAAGGLQAGAAPTADAAPAQGLSLTASVAPTAVSRVGQPLAYAVVVRNRGADDLTDLLVTDPAAGLSELVCSPVAQGGTLAGGASTTCRATRTTTTADLAAASLTDTVKARARSGSDVRASAATTVTVAVQAPAPKATDDTATVVAGGPWTLLAGATNDAPAQSGGPALDPSRTVLVGGTPDPAYPGKAATTAEGRWWVQADGSVRFQVGSGPGGTTAQVGYRVYDLAGRSAVGQLRVPVLAGPADDSSILVLTTRQDRPVDADVLATADAGLGTTGDPAVFDPRSLRLTSVWPRIGYSVTYLATRLRIRIGDVGDFLVADGRIRFTPAPGFHGATPAITWTASTDAGTWASGRVSATVQQQSTALAQLNGYAASSYTVGTDANGIWTGLKLMSASGGTTQPISSAGFYADLFFVQTRSGARLTFTDYQGGTLTVPNLIIGSSNLGAGAVNSRYVAITQSQFYLPAANPGGAPPSSSTNPPSPTGGNSGGGTGGKVVTP